MQYSRGLGTASRRSLPDGWRAVCACAAIALLLAGILRGGTPNLSRLRQLLTLPLPDFSLPAEQNGALLPHHVALRSLGGTPVVLVFFNTLCVHCGGTAQAVADVSGNPLGTHALFIDSPAETAAIADAYAQRLGIEAPLLLDSDGAVAARYGIASYPVTLLIDGAGSVRDTWAGEVGATSIQRALASLTAR